MGQALPERPSIDEWVARLSDEELPLFAHTARRIASISEQNLTSVAHMAEVILSDSAMTARVLRTANSAYYNPTSQTISTVSKAIVVLGFNTVRNIALSITMVDTVLSGVQHDRAIEELVRSFHAAIQAKEIAMAQGQLDVEEVFIAALLRRLGNMVFWCFPYGYAHVLDYEYCQSRDEETAELNILGFSLKQLTRVLTQEWHLSQILDRALDDTNQEGEENHRLIDCIELGYELAIAAEAGWRERKTKKMIFEIASFLEKEPEETLEIVYGGARIACRTIKELGIDPSIQFVPEPPELKKVGELEEDYSEQKEQYELQLSILRELSIMLSERFELNTLLGTVLEGIHRSLHMDRTLFALTTQGTIKAKHVMGENRDLLLKEFDFALADEEQDVFNYVLSKNTPLWVSRKNRAKYTNLITTEVIKCIGNVEFFVMPIRVGGKPRGILYADRRVNREPLDMQSFQTFRHFCEHANIAFNFLSR